MLDLIIAYLFTLHIRAHVVAPCGSPKKSPRMFIKCSYYSNSQGLFAITFYYSCRLIPFRYYIETELKWIKLLLTSFPLEFNDNIHHEGNISKRPDFDVFSLLEIRKCKSR